MVHKLELKLNGVYSSSRIALYSFEPNLYAKQYSRSDKYLTLFGALYFIFSNNKDALEDYGLSLEDELDKAVMSDDELYLNNFEGYQLSSRLTLKTLYLSTGGRIIASIYDHKKDRFLDFLTNKQKGDDCMIATYNNINEFKKALECRDDYAASLEQIVKALNFTECKKILLGYISLEQLQKAYDSDECLNNIYEIRKRSSDILPVQWQLNCDRATWEWDDIGYRMLCNPKASVRFEIVGLSSLTSIAKACARMVVKEAKRSKLEKNQGV